MNNISFSHGIKWSTNLVNEYAKLLGYQLIGDFINSKTNITLVDDNQYKYTTKLYDFLQKHPPLKFAKSNPFTIENIKIWCQSNKVLFDLISDTYINATTKLVWKCQNKNCNEIFNKTWADISQNQGCPYCKGLKVGLSNCLATKNPKLASEWHPTLNNKLTPYDVTCGSSKNIWWKCSKNPNHMWHTTIKNRNNGNGCPYCSGRLSTFENNLLICNPELCVEWNYGKNNKSPSEYTQKSGQRVWWKCSKCSNEWEAEINNRANGNGCPTCNKSKGENKIELALIKNNILYNIQFTFSNCKYKNPLEFDFYLPDYNMCIEYQGIQHYEPIDFAGRGEEWAKKLFKENQIRDQIKRDYCKTNNIKLLEIPYWEFDNIEKILLKVFKKSKINCVFHSK